MGEGEQSSVEWCCSVFLLHHWSSSLGITNKRVYVGDSIVSLHQHQSVWFDLIMSMVFYIVGVVQISSFNIRDSYGIRSVLWPDTLKIIICVFVAQNIGYTNSLVTSLPHSIIGRPKRVQNVTARLVMEIITLDMDGYVWGWTNRDR